MVRTRGIRSIACKIAMEHTVATARQNRSAGLSRRLRLGLPSLLIAVPRRVWLHSVHPTTVSVVTAGRPGTQTLRVGDAA